MIKSMTGYGKSSLSINSREYQVEIKTVNHKYIDVNHKNATYYKLFRRRC